MLWLVIGLIVVAIIASTIAEQKKVDAMSPSEREQYLAKKQDVRDSMTYGQINGAMICPHCGYKGKIRTKQIDRKKGISGGKATAAVLTGGVSVLATGLSRKERMTRAYCGNCKNAWDF